MEQRIGTLNQDALDVHWFPVPLAAIDIEGL